MPEPINISGLILAGGLATRMGRPKHSLQVDGRSLIERVIDKIGPLCSEIIIVGRNPSELLDLPYKIVRDLEPGQGPLGGLATGLFYARFGWCLAAACDLPFLSPRILDMLVDRASSSPGGPRAVVPDTREGRHPLAAVYSRECLGPARRMLAEGLRKVDELSSWGCKLHPLPEEEMRRVDPHLVSFLNVNTREDLDAARRMVTEANNH